jgi:cell wall-associated NlpC family hydrolase
VSDPRLNPDPAHVTGSDPAQIVVPVADLYRSPDGPRDRQLIFGDAVTILGRRDDWQYVQALKDGYCGYVASREIGPFTAPSHTVTAPATHAYTAANFKSKDRINLTFASLITAISETSGYVETNLGFIPKQHLATTDHQEQDPAQVAAQFLGTPYLWGGNSRWGIDCSGLVQASLLACGIPCPGDSDMQESLGAPASTPYQRNDLLFWKGHVALVTAPDTLIHANASAMATVYEPIQSALKRIATQGDGPITTHRRL